MDYVALKNELLTDPTGLGYASLVAAGQDGDLAVLLNAVRQTINIDRELISSHEIVSAIVPAEWTALSAGERERISFIVGAGEVNPKSQNVRDAFTGAFGAPTITRANIVALLTVKGSRAQQVIGSMVSIADIAQALRST